MTQAIAYLGLLDLGVVGLLPREAAAAVGRSGPNSTELPELIARAARLTVIQFPIVTICTFCVWLFVRSAWRSAEGPFTVILIVFVIMFPFRLFAAALQGFQDLAFLGRLQLASWGLSTVLSILLIQNGHGLFALAASSAVAQFVTTVACWNRLRVRFPGVLRGWKHSASHGEILEYAKKGGWVSISQISQILTMGTDVLLIGKILGPGATVPYSCTGKLAGVLANKPQMMMQAAFPGLSELRGGGSKPRIRHATMALSQAMLAMSGAVACIVLVVNRGFVEWWIGSAQYGGDALTLLIIAAMLVRHWNITFVYSLFCFGYERRLALTGLADGCVSVTASVVLVWLLGPIGAPLGMLTGICLVNIPANVIALAREMGTSPHEVISSSFGWLGRFLVVSGAGILLGRFWSPRSFPSILLVTAITGVVYTSLIIPIVLSGPLGVYLRPKLKILSASFQKMLPAFVD